MIIKTAIPWENFDFTTLKPTCKSGPSFRKRDRYLPKDSSRIRKHHTLFSSPRRRIFSVTLSMNALFIARIYLYCCLVHNNIQLSNSLVRNARIKHVLSPMVSMTRSRGIQRPVWMFSSTSNSIINETFVTDVSVSAATKSFGSSVKTLYKPSRENYGNRKFHSEKAPDFRTHDDEQYSQLDWMVRNTAKVLGEEAYAPGEMTPELIKDTRVLMNRWARRAAVVPTSDAPFVVEKLLQRLLLEKKTVEERNHGKSVDVIPKKHVNIYLQDYNTVLGAWSQSRLQMSADRAEEILLKMEEHREPKPDYRSYNAVIKAFVKNGNRTMCVDKVEQLVLKMDSSCDPNVMPDRRSYDLLLYALANSNRDDAAEKATRHLERMIFRYQHEDKQDCRVQPDINAFNQVIGAWARGKANNYLVEMEKIYDLLLDLSLELKIRPNTDTYNALMGGWLKSNDEKALSRIQELISIMEEDFKKGNKWAQPDRVSLNTLQTALNRASKNSKHLDLEEMYDLPRDSLSQNIRMETVIKSGVGDAPERALDILNEMEKSFRNGQLAMKPDGCSFSAVIKAFVVYNRRNADRRADQLLGRMWNLHRNHGGNPPDISLYNSVMNAYASLKSKRGMEKARHLLRKMESGRADGLPKPNIKTYNTVIKAMRNGHKEEGAIFAEFILSRLESLGKDDPNLLPDVYSYTSVITAYARSSSSKKAEKALKIIHRMTEAQENGNEAAIITIQTFNAALNACAFSDGSVEERARVFETATVLDNLRRKAGILADSVWYSTMLRACSTLISPSEKRENLVDLFFQEACEEGRVNSSVLHQLKFAANHDQRIRLLKKDVGEHDFVQPHELPEEWTCNSNDSGTYSRKS